VAINAKELVENVLKELFILNANQFAVKFYLVDTLAIKNVLQNVFVKKNAKIFVLMAFVMMNAMTFVLNVKKNATLVVSIKNVKKDVGNYVIGSLVIKDAKKIEMWTSMLWTMWREMS
jgi:hypothetical protein